MTPTRKPLHILLSMAADRLPVPDDAELNSAAVEALTRDLVVSVARGREEFRYRLTREGERELKRLSVVRLVWSNGRRVG